MESPTETKQKPVCKLIGTNGNSFALMSEVKKCLRAASLNEEAKEFVQRAMNANSYEEVLCLCCEYTDVR